MEDASATGSGTFFRALAAALGKVRRAPGKDESWVEGVLRVVERDDAERYQRMRRRLGLVQRLGDLAQLRVEEEAIATFGLFCYEVIGDRLPTAAPAGLWLDYIYRNERWLGPCLRVCEGIYAPTWEEIESRPAMIARFVVVYDRQTIEGHERPLQVIQSIVESAKTEEGDRLGPLVWSEDGQELFDFHFRRHGDYPLEAKDIRRQAELLKRVLPAPAVAALASRPGPVRTPLTAAASVEHRARRDNDDEAAPVQASANFERRRQALRSTRSNGVPDESAAPLQAPAAIEEDVRAIEAVTPEVAVEEPEIEAPAAMVEPEPQPKPAAPRALRTRPEQEAFMDRPQMAAMPSIDGEPINITRRIETVRAQLDQIRRIAIDTQEMLADLAPQVEELAAWVADLESVVSRRTPVRRAA